MKNLSIGGFTGEGIVLENAGGDTLQGNYIGLDTTGSVVTANGTGVSILSGNNMLIGNVISGNFGDGVDLTGDQNTLVGNYVGTGIDGLGLIDPLFLSDVPATAVWACS